jgi:allantoinase
VTFALRSERVLTPEGIAPKTIVIDGGVIAAVTDEPRPDARDLGKLVLMPGLVDCHVHVNEPGRTEWEGFATATRAAASGGVTSVVDMPLNSSPVTTTVAALEQKLASTRDKLWVDVGFWGGVVPGNEGDLAPLARAGVLGCKAFLCHSGLDEFPNVTREDLERAMPRLRDAGVPLLAHAELDLGGPLCAEGSRTHASWLASRPKSWEDAAIALLIELCRENRCPVHIVHLSSSTALPMLRDAKAEGLPITVETCPHYLCIDAESIPEGATEFKCAPPIRERSNRDRLWEGLLDGTIDFVISDHSPCTPSLKGDGDFGSAWGGVASLSLGLSSVFTEMKRRGVPLERLADWMSRRPAEFAGLGKKKGRIAPGYAADLCAFDPDRRELVSRDRLAFRHRISPYLGRELEGVVAHTWLGGVEVFDGASFSRPRGRALLGREELS